MRNRGEIIVIVASSFRLRGEKNMIILFLGGLNIVSLFKLLIVVFIKVH